MATIAARPTVLLLVDEAETGDKGEKLGAAGVGALTGALSAPGGVMGASVRFAVAFTALGATVSLSGEAVSLVNSPNVALV
jgi:hypothetical protein